MSRAVPCARATRPVDVMAVMPRTPSISRTFRILIIPRDRRTESTSRNGGKEPEPAQPLAENAGAPQVLVAEYVRPYGGALDAVPRGGRDDGVVDPASKTEHTMRRIGRTLLLVAVGGSAVTSIATAQRGGTGLPDSVKARRWELENELASLAIIDRKVMIPMRDGIRIPADIYRPKDTSKKYATIWVRTPYNFNFWDVANGV